MFKIFKMKYNEKKAPLWLNVFHFTIIRNSQTFPNCTTHARVSANTNYDIT